MLLASYSIYLIEKCLSPRQESVHTEFFSNRYIFHNLYNVTLTRENELTSIDLDKLMLSFHVQAYIGAGFECLVTQGARVRHLRSLSSGGDSEFGALPYPPIEI